MANYNSKLLPQCRMCQQPFTVVERKILKSVKKHQKINYCVKCYRIYSKKYERNHAIANSKNRRKNKLRVIHQFGDKCQLCGYNDLSCVGVFEFHHLNPDTKESKIADLMSQYYKKTMEVKLQKELKNCILVCANCHRKIHWSNYNGNKV